MTKKYYIADVFPLERVGFIGTFADGEVEVRGTGFPVVHTAASVVPLHLKPRRVRVNVELLCDQGVHDLNPQNVCRECGAKL